MTVKTIYNALSNSPAKAQNDVFPNPVTGSKSIFTAFAGVIRFLACDRVFYFGLTPTDIKPVNHQSLSVPYVLAGGVVCDRSTITHKVGSLNSRAFGGRRECRLSLDKLKRIPPALTADAKDGSGEQNGTVFARG